jgi:N-sulfoglucosamine sulfohydrolase
MIKLRTLLFFFLSLGCFMNAQEKKPNILWIVCEDISPTLSMYGDKTAKTPNLDKLATQSIIYQNAFATTGVCAPSRSAIITGMLPTSIGTMYMRTGSDVMSWGKRKYKEVATKGEGESKEAVLDLKGNTVREYSAVVPENIKCFTEYLRANGYYCTNNQKTDYQFAAPLSAWDENDPKAHWRNSPKGKPFFSVFNIGDTHESKLWLNNDLPLTVNPATVPVPPYFPDNEIARKDIARHYSNIEIMDKNVGFIIDELKKDGLYDNTIIFFYSDHGGPLPHQKREIYDYGLQAPLMIKGINQKNSQNSNRLISFTDLGPTVLSLANVKPPQDLDGKSFLGQYEVKPRKYVYGTSDRFDEFTDRIRSVRTEHYVYIKNYHPDFTKYKDVQYRKKVPLMVNMLELKAKNQLNGVQMAWFQTKEKEELYDVRKDPFSTNNLAAKPEYKAVLEELRLACSQQFDDKFDYASRPESEMISKMWPNNQQPITETPNHIIKDKTIALSCPTKGSSLSYIISDSKDEKFDLNSNWNLYTKPIQIASSKYIYVIANRIGFVDSEIKLIELQ